MRRKIGLLALLMMLCIAATAHADGLTPLGTALVDGHDADRVHFREGPSSSAQSLGLLFTGTEVWYYSNPNEPWVTVGLPNAKGPEYSVIGYIKSEYLYAGDPMMLAPRFRQAHITGIAANSWVNLREDIGYRVGTLAQLRLGEIVTVMGELAVDGGWSLVQAGDQTGYVVTSYLQYDDPVYINGRDSDRVHLRVSASQSSNSLGLYFTGTRVLCLSDMRADWVKVQIGAVTGYMMSRYLTTDVVVPKQPVATVCNIASNDSLSLYQVPRARALLAGTARYGERLTVLGETSDGWYYVTNGDVYGYASINYLRMDDSTGTVAAVIDGKTSDRVHLREGAGTNYASLGLYFTGTPVTCLSDINDTWVKVQIGAATGYMMSKYLSIEPVAPQYAAGTVDNSKAGTAISIYKIPQERTQTVATALGGERITVLGETQDGWYYVQYNGEYGYARSALIRLK